MKAPLKCECGKIVAFQRDGKIYVKCKKCNRQVELKIENPEPKGRSEVIDS